MKKQTAPAPVKTYNEQSEDEQRETLQAERTKLSKWLFDPETEANEIWYAKLSEYQGLLNKIQAFDNRYFGGWKGKAWETFTLVQPTQRTPYN